MKKMIVMAALLTSSVYAAREIETGTGSIKVTTTIKIDDRTTKREHVVAPSQHVVYVEMKSGLIFDAVVTQGLKEEDVEIKLLVKKRENGQTLAEQTKIAKWGKEATFTCPVQAKDAKISMVVTQV